MTDLKGPPEAQTQSKGWMEGVYSLHYQVALPHYSPENWGICIYNTLSKSSPTLTDIAVASALAERSAISKNKH